MISTMEAPAMLENGKALQSRRSVRLRAASYTLIFAWVIISVLVPIIFCLLYHQQARGTCWAHGSLNDSSTPVKGEMSWDWKLENCKGVVQDQGQYLIIQQSGKYFIYAQLFRKEKIHVPFALILFKHPEITLNNAVGHENGTVNFARPFHLQKGDKLYCKKNHNLNHIVLKSQTYWGLFKM
ncbi:hypothetical protein Nmel_011139 [Mimus melanotis]